jgi:hypothetical protein
MAIVTTQSRTRRQGRGKRPNSRPGISRPPNRTGVPKRGHTRV